MCVCDRESVYVNVCVCEREREGASERERGRARGRERAGESVCEGERCDVGLPARLHQKGRTHGCTHHTDLFCPAGQVISLGS